MWTQRLLLIALLLLISAPASAQIIGPGPKQGKLQIGAWWAFMHYDQLFRHVEYSELWQLRRDEPRDRAALVLRYGVTRAHYLIMNFGVLQRKHEPSDGAPYNSIEGVWGLGGNVNVFTIDKFSIRLGGEYNDVFEFRSNQERRPWRGQDARIVLAGDRTWKNRCFAITPSAGLMFFSAREKEYEYFGGLIREKNRHYFSPVIAGLVSIGGRINLGLELTFGAITDFRWRTEIQL